MEHIGLFCAASDRLEASYYDLAGAVGRFVGERGLTLVYGGADSGLMESAARGVKDAGGHVVGIVPSVLETRRRVSITSSQASGSGPPAFSGTLKSQRHSTRLPCSATSFTDFLL